MNKTHAKKEAFVRVVKREELSTAKIAFISCIAFLVALVAGGLFILALGHNPFQVYASIVNGAFRSEIAIKGMVKIAIPLLITSLGITLAFKMKFWNIGAEGQVIMGAVFATYFALYCNGLPHWLLIILMIVAGIIGGGLWGLIPAYFKSKYNTNETLFTLMLNYIAQYIVRFLVEGPWRDPKSSGFPKIATFEKNARLDQVFGVHMGWVIGLILVVIVFAYLRHSKQGYEIGVVGESQNTARYAGMNVKKIVLRTMFFSGAICGIAGMTQATGAAFTLSEDIAGGVGFTAIIVAWLAKLNPFVIVLVTFLFAILEKGCSVMQSAFGLSTNVSAILQGIILFFILGFDFFTRYKFVFRKNEKKNMLENERNTTKEMNISKAENATSETDEEIHAAEQKKA